MGGYRKVCGNGCDGVRKGEGGKERVVGRLGSRFTGSVSSTEKGKLEMYFALYRWTFQIEGFGNLVIN